MKFHEVPLRNGEALGFISNFLADVIISETSCKSNSDSVSRWGMPSSIYGLKFRVIPLLNGAALGFFQKRPKNNNNNEPQLV